MPMPIPVHQNFGIIFSDVFNEDAKLKCKALEKIEKITKKHPYLLESKKGIILDVMAKVELPEIQAYVAKILPRLSLNKKEMKIVKNILDTYLKSNSTNVQKNTLQAISDLARQGKINKRGAIWSIYFFMSHSSVATLIARSKKLLKALEE